MKLPAAVLLLAVGSSASTAVTLKNVRPSVATFQERHLNSRQLGISEECLAATEDLYNTAAISSANTAWVEELRAFDGNCIQNGMAGTCTFDSKALSTHDAFVSACTEAGGTPAFFSDSFYCSVMEGDAVTPVTFAFVDVPECIASSCEEILGQTLVTAFVEQTSKFTQEELSSEFDSVTCADVPTSMAFGLDAKASFGIMSVASALAWLLL